MKTTRYNKNIALVSVAALCVTSFAIGAHADETGVRAPARTVHYADLDLNTRVGAEVLYKRVRSAAEEVCGDVGSRQLTESMAAKACIDKAIAASVRAVNNRQLTITYNEHFGAARTAVSVASLG